jgi:serine/threonine protein kinase
MFESLTLSNLPERQCGILRPPTNTRPIIWVVEEGGVRAVVKDFSRSRFFFRNTVGRFLVWRESKAYQRLTGIRGVPNLYGMIDGLALILEEIPGRDLGNPRAGKNPPDDFFDNLKALVRGIHARGLAHCDLKKARNTLLGRDGLPYIVDWGASIAAEEFRFSILRLIYRRFLVDDHAAVVKLKLHYTPQEVTPEERIFYERRGKGGKVIRALRDRLKALFQRVA